MSQGNFQLVTYCQRKGWLGLDLCCRLGSTSDRCNHWCCRSRSYHRYASQVDCPCQQRREWKQWVCSWQACLIVVEFGGVKIKALFNGWFAKRPVVIWLSIPGKCVADGCSNCGKSVALYRLPYEHRMTHTILLFHMFHAFELDNSIVAAYCGWNDVACVRIRPTNLNLGTIRRIMARRSVRRIPCGVVKPHR